MSEVTIYEPNAKQKLGFFKSWWVMLSNIILSRELIFQLFKRDFLAAYKKSFIGMTWIIVSPIIGIISWIFMNSTGLLNAGDVGIPYPAYVLLSTSIWSLFIGFYRSASGSLSAGAGFILQVKYPHEVLLIKQIGEHLANFSLSFTMSIIVLFSFGVIPSWKIVFFPLLALPLLFLGSAIGLVASLLSVVALDIKKGIDFALGLAMFITPVIYSPKFDNMVLQEIIKWNPLTYLIGNVRDIIIYGTFHNVEAYAISTAICLLSFIISWRLFFVSEEKVIEKMI